MNLWGVRRSKKPPCAASAEPHTEPCETQCDLTCARPPRSEMMRWDPDEASDLGDDPALRRSSSVLDGRGLRLRGLPGRVRAPAGPEPRSPGTIAIACPLAALPTAPFGGGPSCLQTLHLQLLGLGQMVLLPGPAPGEITGPPPATQSARDRPPSSTPGPSDSARDPGSAWQRGCH